MDFQTPDHEALGGAGFQTPDGEALPDEGALAAAGRGALRNFPGAQQLAAAAAPINPMAEKRNYSDELAHLTDAAERSKEAHPVAYGAGATAGTLAPLAIPGVGGALEAAPFLGNAALGAAGGASDLNLTKPSGRDLATVAGQGLIAGTAGKALSGLGKLFAKAPAGEAVAEGAAEASAPAAKAAAEAAPAAPAVPKPPLTPKDEIAGVVVPSKKVAPDFKPTAERIYASNLAKGLGGTPRQLMRVFGKQNPIEAMNEIGDWMDSAGPGGTSIHGLLDRPGELLEKIDKIHESSGKAIGEMIDQMGETMPTKLRAPLGEGTKVFGVDYPAMINDLKEAALNTADPQTEARILKMIKTAEHLSEKGVSSDFEILQQLKGMAGKQISKDPEISQVYGSLADRMTKLVDQFGAAINNPAVKEVYDKAKLDYHNSSRLLPMLRYVEGRELVGGPAGHFSLRGLLSTIVNTGAGVVGLPPVEQLGKNVMLKTAPTVRSAANVRPPSPSIKGMTPAVAQELSAALEGLYGKKKEGK